MKLLIDIPEGYYKAIKTIPSSKLLADTLLISNGKPLSEMTNGEVINEIFPWCCSVRHTPPYVSPFYSTLIDGHTDFTEEFWDAKYEGAGE